MLLVCSQKSAVKLSSRGIKCPNKLSAMCCFSPVGFIVAGSVAAWQSMIRSTDGYTPPRLLDNSGRPESIFALRGRSARILHSLRGGHQWPPSRALIWANPHSGVKPAFRRPEFVLFALRDALSGDVLKAKQNCGVRANLVEHLAGIQEHRTSPDVRRMPTDARTRSYARSTISSSDDDLANMASASAENSRRLGIQGRCSAVIASVAR